MEIRNAALYEASAVKTHFQIQISKRNVRVTITRVRRTFRDNTGVSPRPATFLFVTFLYGTTLKNRAEATTNEYLGKRLPPDSQIESGHF